MILSITSSSSTTATTLFTYSAATRVSASPSTTSCSLKSGSGGVRRRSLHSCLVFCSSKLRGLTEAVDEKSSSSCSTAAAAAVEVTTSACGQDEISTPRNFLDARTEQDLLLGIQNEVEAGRLPINVAQGMEELYHNYRNAGENVILISNHQTEADSAIIALLLESRHPFIAENMICVAGDRVVTDPLCKPFSMGRNLLCVYSKKHMNDDPELIEMKKRANTKSLKEMAMLLRGGSKIIWIAPSGGRDRPNPVTKEWYPAPFDASSVDNMRRLADHAGVPSHIYPLAILCYDVMPPPPQVEKEIGEKRVISFHGVGLSVAPKISFQEIIAALGDPEEAKVAYTQTLYSSVFEQYNVLKSAIHGKQGLKASTPTISLSQPWQKCF